MLQAEGLGWAKVPKYVWKLQVSCSLLVMGVELSESQTGEEPLRERPGYLAEEFSFGAIKDEALF